MSEQSPFDRYQDSPGSRDKNARAILIGMGALGLLLLILVLPPISLFSSGGDKSSDGDSGGNLPAAQSSSSGGGSSGKTPKAPEGFEALSLLMKVPEQKGTKGPYDLTVNLLQPQNDNRNLGLYTEKNGKWERLATATLLNNGTAAKGQVAELPDSVAVLRRTISAVQVTGWIAPGVQPDPAALDVLTTVNPVDFTPNADGSLSGSSRDLPSAKASIMPTVRAADQATSDAVNTILASPSIRDAHINALVQLAQTGANAGVDIDYQRVNTARKADFTSFVTVLADRLHQANKSLTITLPAPVKAGVTWDMGAYDWEQLAKSADLIKMTGEPDPSAYYTKMTDIFNFLKPKVDLKKVSLIITRMSHEKGNDGLTALSLKDCLQLASEIEVRTNTSISPNSSVLIVGKNIFQDDGASGLKWDEEASAVSFAYPGRGGQRTVWIENTFSVAFRLDLARRFGLGGVAVENIGQDPNAPAIWDTLRVFGDTGGVNLILPNAVMLRPAWEVQAGTSEPNLKGEVVWRAPAQAGAYDVSLIVSDGVIRAMQKITLSVGAATSPTPNATTTGTAKAGTPTPTATVRP